MEEELKLSEQKDQFTFIDQEGNIDKNGLISFFEARGYTSQQGLTYPGTFRCVNVNQFFKQQIDNRNNTNWEIGEYVVVTDSLQSSHSDEEIIEKWLSITRGNKEDASSQRYNANIQKLLLPEDDYWVVYNYQGKIAQVGTLDEIVKQFDQKRMLTIDEVNTAPTKGQDEVRSMVVYSKKNFLNDVFLDEDEYDELIALLLAKKNVILEGVPGVGKTYIARRLAYSLLGSEKSENIEMIQFHQSYGYEDFIMGYKPNKDGNGFYLKEGVFYSFCKKAESDLDNKYFFVIDEINRGNLSKIFGEVMMLMECDKRKKEMGVKLSYRDECFFIPPNVYIIGLMNTADRSLALIDYALRRRFCFFEINPAFDKDKFSEYLTQFIPSTLVSTIKQKFTSLNKFIGDEKESGLGREFRIGHSYFCNRPLPGTDPGLWYKNIVKYEIAPLLREYWWDSYQKAVEYIDKLKIQDGQ